MLLEVEIEKVLLKKHKNLQKMKLKLYACCLKIVHLIIIKVQILYSEKNGQKLKI